MCSVNLLSCNGRYDVSLLCLFGPVHHLYLEKTLELTVSMNSIDPWCMLNINTWAGVEHITDMFQTLGFVLITFTLMRSTQKLFLYVCFYLPTAPFSLAVIANISKG